LGLIVQKSASIVFCKSNPESPGPGDIALEKQKRVSQEQKRKSATEKCNRGAISTVSIHIQTFPIFFFYFLFIFPILNRQRQGQVLLWIFRVDPLRGKLQGSTLFFPHFSILSTFCQECCQRIVYEYHPHLCDSNNMHTVRRGRCILIVYIQN